MAMDAATRAYKDVSSGNQRDNLILEHLEYVQHILRKMLVTLPASVDAENLESAGTLGLIEAAKQFDPDRGVAFKSFAYPRIRGEIIDELRRNSPLPQRMLQAAAKIRSVCETLPPPVTPEMIATETDLTVDEVENCLEAMRLARPGAWSETERAAASGDSNPAQSLEQEEYRRMIADCIEELPEQERLVLELYYMEDLRLREIAEVVELSESRVSRILSRAEFRLREHIRIREID